MRLSTKYSVFFLVVSLIIIVGCTEKPALVVTNPAGSLTVQISEEDGKVYYQVFLKGDTVVLKSQLGLDTDGASFSSELRLEEVSEVLPISDAYEMAHGKQASISYSGNRRVFTFKNAQNRKLEVVFQVSDDGVAVRYRLSESPENQVITKEYTSFVFPNGSKSFVQPMAESKSGWQQCNPSYEEHYLEGIAPNAPAPMGQGWIFPSLFQVSDSSWVLISETGVERDFCGSHLNPLPDQNGVEIAFAQPQDIIPGQGYLPTGSVTPWRILTIGTLGTIVESTLGTDLATPKITINESIVKPGIASWSWAVLKDNSVNYETTLEFIDYATDMGWSYCLVDADWDTRIGWEKIGELSQYATSKGIGLWVWYNSAGDWNTTPYHPRSKLLTHEDRLREFNRLKSLGIVGVKIDFFGGDGQSMMAYYHDILIDAAEVGLLINFHGATLPRGWQRTYPNLMTMESIRGFEFITFGQGDADKSAKHCTMLPFTRNAFDPMDFTPMCFSEIPNIQRKTTNGFELALPTLFLSGVQHLAEIPSGMASVPDYVREYLRDIPVKWDETRFVTGYPGKEVVIARRRGADWFVAGINGELVEKTLDLDLSFLKGKTGVMITDGAAHPEFMQQNLQLDTEGHLLVSLKPNGGFAIKAK